MSVAEIQVVPVEQLEEMWARGWESWLVLTDDAGAEICDRETLILPRLPQFPGDVVSAEPVVFSFKRECRTAAFVGQVVTGDQVAGQVDYPRRVFPGDSIRFHLKVVGA